MEGKPCLVHIIPSNKWGGVQTYAFDICRHYHDKGWEVTALTRNAVWIDSRFNACGIPMVHAPLGGLLDMTSIHVLSRLLKKMPLGKGVVHVHRYRDAFTALLARKLAGRPDIRIIATRHTVRHGRTSPVFRKIYASVDAHIFVSEMAYTAFLHPRHAIELDAGRAFLLRNSLNIPADGRANEPTTGPVVAMYCGPVVAGKGLEMLIDAMAQLRDLKMRLRICGTGNPDYIDLLRRRAITRNVMDSIDWNLKDSENAVVPTCHFGVAPSIEREACGISNIRFMAFGRPQITTNNGAQTEYLKEGETALIVPPADAAALADAMRRLASDPALRASIGEKAFEVYSKELSWEHFTHTLDLIYHLK